MDNKKVPLLQSIGAKMIIFCLIMLVIPITLVGTISYQTAKSETDALIEKDLKHSVQFAVQMAGLLQRSVEEGIMTLDEAQEMMREMLLGPKQADGTRPINRNIDLGENGYFFVLDTQGTFLAHPLMEGENTWDKQSSDGIYYIQDMIEKGVNGGGFTYYVWPLPDQSKEALKVSYSLLMPEWGWVFGAGSYMQDYNGGQERILESVWITLALCIVIGAALIYIFARYLARPIKQMAGYAHEIAGGNLALPPLAIKRNDEIGRLAVHFGEMANTLRLLVGDAKRIAEQVDASAEKLASSMDYTTGATQQITEAIEKLSVGLENQAKSTEESARVMEEMSQGVQQIAETAAAAFELSEEMSRHAQDGNGMIRQSVAQMNSVDAAFGEMASAISELSRYIQVVEDISLAINEIAGQTQLLALNASIEAARAGEHGQGFAVVAAEVRKLADQAMNASRQIAGMMESARTTIRNTEEVVERSENEVNQGVRVIEETGRMFRSILESAQLVLEKITEVSSTSQQMSAGTQQIAASIQEISKISADSSERAREVTAAAEEQLAMISEVNGKADELREQSQHLKSQVDKFRV
jgi:methyl-accepting chemotaxis protein